MDKSRCPIYFSRISISREKVSVNRILLIFDNNCTISNDAEKPWTGQDEKRLGLRMKKQRRPDCIASHVLQPGTVRPGGADCTPGESDFRLRGRDGVWGLLSNQLVAVTSPARLRTTADRSRANITAGQTLFVSDLSAVGTLGR